VVGSFHLAVCTEVVLDSSAVEQTFDLVTLIYRSFLGLSCLPKDSEASTSP
jgi:hypothetical protein